MLKFRTKLLLFLIALFGIGIGVLSSWADGAYSAVCLFVLPILVALAGASIIADLGSNMLETKAGEPAQTSERSIGETSVGQTENPFVKHSLVH